MNETLKRAAELLRKQAKLVLGDNIETKELYVFSNSEREAADMVIVADELERMVQPTNGSIDLFNMNKQLQTTLENVVSDIECLISESYGVSGLHLNGDVAPWSDLEAGGAYERLSSIPLAYEILAVAGEPNTTN